MDCLISSRLLSINYACLLPPKSSSSSKYSGLLAVLMVYPPPTLATREGSFVGPLRRIKYPCASDEIKFLAWTAKAGRSQVCLACRDKTCGSKIVRVIPQAKPHLRRHGAPYPSASALRLTSSEPASFTVHTTRSPDEAFPHRSRAGRIGCIAVIA